MTKEEYLLEFDKELTVGKKYKDRIMLDVEKRIDEALDADPYFDIARELGTPNALAEHFEVIVVENISKQYKGNTPKPYEYKSQRKLFGLPLVHINTGGKFATKKAKGIVAIGDIATGVVAIGGLSFGVLSLGGLAFGLVTLGGLAVGGLALGGITIGALSIGGIALGLFSLGGISIALIKGIGGLVV